jgi:hypothetical protein
VPGTYLASSLTMHYTPCESYFHDSERSQSQPDSRKEMA